MDSNTPETQSVAELERRLVAMEQESAWLRGRLLAQRAPKSRRVWWLAAGLAFAFVLFNAGVLWSKPEDCAEGLVCFAEKTPAKASEVNQNFKKLHDWVVAKVGAVGTAGISVGSANITDIKSESITVGGPLTLSGTSDLSVLGSVGMFGPSLDRSSSPEQISQAKTDGLVLVFITAAGTSELGGAGCTTGSVKARGHVGPSQEGPYEVRGAGSAHVGCRGQDYDTPFDTFLMPVRKGEWYKVEKVAGSPQDTKVTFFPLGDPNGKP
jgi:hypothetical protein